MNYQNKVILITGVYRGIGKALCEYFSRLHATLIITYHNHQEETKELKNRLFNNNINIDMQYLDLQDEKSIINLREYVKQKYHHLDVLINNASVSLDNEITDKTKEEFMKVLEINVVGNFLMMKYFDNIIHDGYIFNISSTDGIDTGNIYSIDYNASKAAINSMTKTFSMYSNNKIISICPNWVDTESTREMSCDYLKSELKRVKQVRLINPDEIVKVIDKCMQEHRLSGTIIRIDGDKDE